MRLIVKFFNIRYKLFNSFLIDIHEQLVRSGDRVTSLLRTLHAISAIYFLARLSACACKNCDGRVSVAVGRYTDHYQNLG